MDAADLDDRDMYVDESTVAYKMVMKQKGAKYTGWF